MSKRIEFNARGGHKTEGAFAEPAGTGKAPAVVLIQEYWGINENMRKLTDRMASEGFLALTPDLFHGKEAKNASEAGHLMQGLDWPHALEDVQAAVVHLQEHPRGNGKVGVMGFCMGGALCFAAACRISGLAAVVPFYGIPDPKLADYGKVTAPIQAHFAKKDDWAKPSLAEAIKEQVTKAGKSMELYVYDTGHAFMNEQRQEAFHPESSKLAWQRTLAFLHKHLG